MKLETAPFDPADYVITPQDAAAYLTDAMASGDAAVVAAALGTIARAHGAGRLAKAAGLSRAALYNGLTATGNPTLATMMSVLGELGLTLAAEAREPVES